MNENIKNGWVGINISRQNQVRHGLSNTNLYQRWYNMMYRCYNVNSPNYEDYGARGIKVCNRWHDVSNFVEDIKFIPDGLEIDRINNDGDYFKENIKFSTRKQQVNNTRHNRIIEYNGEKLNLGQWADRFGLSIRTLKFRLDRSNWNIEKALKTPVGELNPYEVLFTFNNKTQCIADWSREYNISYQTLWHRIFKRNWTLEKSLLTPIKNNHGRKIK